MQKVWRIGSVGLIILIELYWICPNLFLILDQNVLCLEECISQLIITILDQNAVFCLKDWISQQHIIIMLDQNVLCLEYWVSQHIILILDLDVFVVFGGLDQ